MHGRTQTTQRQSDDMVIHTRKIVVKCKQVAKINTLQIEEEDLLK
jgi:hypothetical protein